MVGPVFWKPDTGFRRNPTYPYLILAMKTRMFSLSLLLVLFGSLLGCVSRYQYETDRSLLVQENQTLEDALYVTHHQLADAVKENESLRARLGDPGADSDGTVSRPSGEFSLPPARRPVAPSADGEDYAPPEVSFPEESEGTTQPPEMFRRTPSSIKPPATRTVTNSAPPAFPEWSPRR